MKMIFNEKKYVEDILALGKFTAKPSTDIYMLTKYYFHMGYRSEEIIEKIMEFVQVASNNPKAWKSRVKQTVKNFKGAKLNIVEEIHLTQSELDAIFALTKEHYQKLAFGLLVWLKVINTARGKQNDWMNLEDTVELFKDIQVNRNSADRDFMIGTLEEWGYVFNTVRSGSCAVKINYVDWEGAPVLTITSFSDFIADYYLYKKEKVIRCTECNKRIVVKKNARTKYCKSCARNANARKNCERVKKHRENQKKCKCNDL